MSAASEGLIAIQLLPMCQAARDSGHIRRLRRLAPYERNDFVAHTPRQGARHEKATETVSPRTKLPAASWLQNFVLD